MTLARKHSREREFPLGNKGDSRSNHQRQGIDAGFKTFAPQFHLKEKMLTNYCFRASPLDGSTVLCFDFRKIPSPFFCDFDFEFLPLFLW